MALLIKTAQQLGFSHGQILSSDTTVQEPAIGYPTEPGILKGWAQRIERASSRLKARGVKAGAGALAQVCEKIIHAGIAEARSIVKSKW